MTTPNPEPGYFDVLVALAVFERTGSDAELREIAARGRELPEAVWARICKALLLRSQTAGRRQASYTKNLPLCRAIEARYRRELARLTATGRPLRSETPAKTARCAVMRAEPFSRLRLTEAAVIRAVTIARKNPP